MDFTLKVTVDLGEKTLSFLTGTVSGFSNVIEGNSSKPEKEPKPSKEEKASKEKKTVKEEKTSDVVGGEDKPERTYQEVVDLGTKLAEEGNLKAVKAVVDKLGLTRLSKVQADQYDEAFTLLSEI